MPNLEWGQTWPSLEEFTELAHDRRVLPVVRKLLVDDVTPVSVYRNLAKGLPGTFVLESAESDGTWGRYSFVGVHSQPPSPWRTAKPCGPVKSPKTWPTLATRLTCSPRFLTLSPPRKLRGCPRSPAV